MDQHLFIHALIQHEEKKDQKTFQLYRWQQNDMQEKLLNNTGGGNSIILM